MAKSRVAPIKSISIPRLELLGCLIGARLANSVQSALKLDGVKHYFWTDSSTALAWIKKSEQWGTFVSNRTEEIGKRTNIEDWRHVPGCKNPADLPSRGCTTVQLFESKWWEGPDWLRYEEHEWPQSEGQQCEEDIIVEKRCTSVAWDVKGQFSIYKCLSKAYSFDATIRITAWVLRFLHNIRKKAEAHRIKGKLKFGEIQKAEICFLKNIQSVAFTENRKKELHGIQIFEDNNGLLRVKLRLTYRDDPASFKYPVLLPGKAPEVKQLVRDWHRYYCHPPIGSLQVKLRKKFWILKQKNQF